MKSEAFLPKGADRAATITFLVDGNTLDWLQSESDRTGIGIEKLASAMLYADWLITTTFGRDVVESCISIERQSGYVSRNSGRSFGMLAGEIALQQAEADLDSLFFDSGDFEERFLRGVADYDVENALREI